MADLKIVASELEKFRDSYEVIDNLMTELKKNNINMELLDEIIQFFQNYNVPVNNDDEPLENLEDCRKFYTKVKTAEYHRVYSLLNYYKYREKKNKRRFQKVKCEDCGYYYTPDKKNYHFNIQKRHQRIVNQKKNEEK